MSPMLHILQPQSTGALNNCLTIMSGEGRMVAA
jgi:hypothetical protein